VKVPLVAFHVPNFMSIALPIPPRVSPVDSLKSEGMSPKPTRPFGGKFNFENMSFMVLHTLLTYVVPPRTTDTAGDTAEADFVTRFLGAAEAGEEYASSTKMRRESNKVPAVLAAIIVGVGE
jgi:hypothetical protein